MQSALLAPYDQPNVDFAAEAEGTRAHRVRLEGVREGISTSI